MQTIETQDTTPYSQQTKPSPMYIIIRLSDLRNNAIGNMKNLPTVTHKNFVDAKVEAERLAYMNPGSHFGIFQCTEAVCTTITSPNWVKL